MNYILFGEQYPMVRKRLNKILSDRLVSPDDFNVVKLDYNETTIDEIVSESLSLPLGYDAKAVVIDNCVFLQKDGKKEEQTKILDLLKESLDEVNIIFVLRNNKADKTSDIYKYVEENGQICEFMNLTPQEWPAYVKKYFTSKNIQIEKSAIDELIKRVDGDLNLFMNEANKLCLYTNNVKLSDILLLVSKPLEDDAFQMSNALFKGDNALALSIYRNLQLLGSKFVDTLIPMLATQFRFISQVCFLENHGLDNASIAKQLGVSEGRVYMALKNARYLSRRQIARILDDLYNLDLQIKSGQIDRSYGLELFLINFPN